METPHSILKTLMLMDKNTQLHTIIKIRQIGNGSMVMVKNNAHHAFEPKYLLGYMVL